MESKYNRKSTLSVLMEGIYSFFGFPRRRELFFLRSSPKLCLRLGAGAEGVLSSGTGGTGIAALPPLRKRPAAALRGARAWGSYRSRDRAVSPEGDGEILSLWLGPRGRGFSASALAWCTFASRGLSNTLIGNGVRGSSFFRSAGCVTCLRGAPLCELHMRLRPWLSSWLLALVSGRLSPG